MSWHFQPVDNNCTDCQRPINIQRERHYIVYAPALSTPEKDAYKRCCAACYDKAKQRPYERRSASDGYIANTVPPEPTVI